MLLVGHRIGCGKIAALARGLRVGGVVRVVAREVAGGRAVVAWLLFRARVCVLGPSGRRREI